MPERLELRVARPVCDAMSPQPSEAVEVTAPHAKRSCKGLTPLDVHHIMEWPGWRVVLDSELRDAGGVLSWRALQDRMRKRYVSEVGTGGPYSLIGTCALAVIPPEYLSAADALVRLPPIDADIATAQKQLQYHCHKFEHNRDITALINRYSRKVTFWKAREQIPTIMKHAVHVAAWVAFASDLGEEVLRAIVLLLADMLSALGQNHPIPRLLLALRHAADRLQHFRDEAGAPHWTATTLERVNEILGRAPAVGYAGMARSSCHATPRSRAWTDASGVERRLRATQQPRGATAALWAPRSAMPGATVGACLATIGLGSRALTAASQLQRSGRSSSGRTSRRYWSATPTRAGVRQSSGTCGCPSRCFGGCS
ncbi:unnamed protein product [Prorocentrum cordatum]|uniref:Uncharacterized protein n=1 Tax=Prorocentrum cordatum TaxID=2364126 RepID=A0ABN9TGX9_9DINO|nr:unnamed protein product [Polarella glacialis]